MECALQSHTWTGTHRVTTSLVWVTGGHLSTLQETFPILLYSISTHQHEHVSTEQG